MRRHVPSLGGILILICGLLLCSAAEVHGFAGLDCQPNGVPDDEDLANGTSQDCNENGVPDECDLADGTSMDCNGTSVPDACELGHNDCNGNGIPDECETDCQGNGIPDDCDLEGTVFRIELDGPQVEPCAVSSSPATGEGSFLLNRETGEASFEITITGLSSPEVVTHLHGPAQLCVGGALVALLPHGNVKTGVVTLSPAHVEAMSDGLLYVKVHTDDYAMGEVRGQVEPVVGEDCNDNGVPDECDVNSGSSEDCDENLMPDECQADADGDGVVDGCDGCPEDPNKPDPGGCGCGLPETGDTDQDGIPDCIDQCAGADDAIFGAGCAEAIPTVSDWGLLILTLLLLTLAKLRFGVLLGRAACLVRSAG